MFGNLMNGLVQAAPSACYDLQTGRLGVRNGNGFGTYDPPKEGSKGKYKTCSVKEFAISVPAFGIRTPVDEIKQGDLIVVGEKSKTEYYFFVSVKKDSGDLENPIISGINTENGKMATIAVPDQAFLPGFGILTVKNLFSTKGGIESIMPLMMLMKQDASSGKANASFGKFLMLTAMCGGNIGSVFGEATGQSGFSGMSGLPVMMMMSNGFKGGMKDIMMMQLLTGNQGNLSKLLPMMALMGSLDDSDYSTEDQEAKDWNRLEVVLKDESMKSSITSVKPEEGYNKNEVIEDFVENGGTVIKDNGDTVLVKTYNECGVFTISKSEVEENTEE